LARQHSGSNLDFDQVLQEWKPGSVRGIYLNSGSCGPKPDCVLRALEAGWRRLNENPTLMTFYDHEIWNNARAAAAGLFGVPAEDLILSQNSTHGIQMVMQSLLRQPGDEFVSTNQEHGCVNTLSRYLSENRGIVVRSHAVDPFAGSEAFCRGILNLVSSKTKLVLVSEINCLTGWRPALDLLAGELESAGVPLLVDGAHSPGQGPVRIASYPYWVGSAHKWLGAPNGCGFLYVRADCREQIRPLLIGDRLYNESFLPSHRLEWPGTCDVVRLLGLVAAIKLACQLIPERVAARQKELHFYLRTSLEKNLPAGTIRTPWVDGETSALFAVYWQSCQLRVSDLRESLWQRHQIWTQPDFASAEPARGMRISCHIFNSEEDIDSLIGALKNLLS
jgi:isopenicillin-N epimerase